MIFKKNKRAFTIIDTIFALVLTIIILSFFNIFIQYIHKVNTTIYQSRQQQWETFILFLEKNTQNCYNIDVTPGRFFCEAYNVPGKMESIKVEVKKGNQDWVNMYLNKGTMVVLNNVTRINYELFEETLQVRVLFTDGEVFSDQIKLAKID